MAHPKRRQSSTRQAKRRTHDKAVAPTLAICPNCGEWHVYHTVCGACGYYRGKLAIEKEADLSEAIALHYCDTWRKVIYDHEYNGEYCTDFNEALAKHQEFIITTDTYKRLKQKKDSIEAIMPQLNDYPSSCKDAYNELVSIYADTDELFRFADEPRGSLSTYSTKTTDLYQKIEKSLKEFKIKHIQNK